MKYIKIFGFNVRKCEDVSFVNLVYLHQKELI